MEPGLYEIATFNPKKANFPNGCHISEVEIDPDTGAVKIVKYTWMMSVSRSIRYSLKDRSMAAAQGAGQILMEDLHINSVVKPLEYFDHASLGG